MKFVTAVVFKGEKSVEATIDSKDIAVYFTNDENEEHVDVLLSSGVPITLFADKGALDAIMNVKE